MSILLDKLLLASTYKSLTWKPVQPGDLIAGRVLTYGFQETTNGTRLLIKVDASDVVQDGQALVPGIYAVWERAQVRQIVEEQRLRVGDLLALRFTGEAPTKYGGAKKEFAGIVERTPESAEWKPLEAPAATAEQRLPRPDDFDDDIPI